MAIIIFINMRSKTFQKFYRDAYCSIKLIQVVDRVGALFFGSIIIIPMQLAFINVESRVEI